MAGADHDVGASHVQTAIFIPGNAASDPDAVIQRHLLGVDLVLTEGYKRGHYQKIEVYRSQGIGESGGESGLLCAAEELMAVVTDMNLALPDNVPQFALDDIAGVGRLLWRLVAKRRNS